MVTSTNTLTPDVPHPQGAKVPRRNGDWWGSQCTLGKGLHCPYRQLPVIWLPALQVRARRRAMLLSKVSEADAEAQTGPWP